MKSRSVSAFPSSTPRVWHWNAATWADHGVAQAKTYPEPKFEKLGNLLGNQPCPQVMTDPRLARELSRELPFHSIVPTGSSG